MAQWNPIILKAPEVKPDFEFDLKGEICPYTFVKSKLALEMLQSAQVLQVVVPAGHRPAPPKIIGERAEADIIALGRHMQRDRLDVYSAQHFRNFGGKGNSGGQRLVGGF